MLLTNRGLKTNKEIDNFLNPPDPSSLEPGALNIKTKELNKAVKRIKTAIHDKESIVVYGDYDADGVCGTTILWETLNNLGAKVMPYIPHRVEEGYGLSDKGIDYVKKEYEASLIITVDHGIGSLDKIDSAKKLGIDVIVVDHHVPPKRLPRAYAVVHTTDLCGAGVAWFLAKTLVLRHPEFISGSKMLNQVQHDENLDLVAIATVADMVSLTGANRVLVKYGLEELNKTKRIGLEALLEESGLEKGKIGVYDVSHILAPRLNAMGRMEHAMDSLRLLCTKNKERARELAHLLNQTNKERQKLLEETFFHAESLHNQHAAAGQLSSKLIFLAHESYNQGIIGLVAGRLVEKFYLPAIVISRGETFSKASARSINGFNIIETIRKVQDLLVDAGGHPMAAGFTVETEKLELVQRRLTEIAGQELDEEKLIRVLKIDAELGLEDLTLELYKEIQKFAPFGLGNPEPVFATPRVVVKEARVIGSDRKHLKLMIFQVDRHAELVSASSTFPAVAFGMSELLPRLSPEKPVDIAYTLVVDEWNGNKRLELKIKDIKIDD